ncbi:MAG TPA: fatty acid desaturase family protein [Burkholderiaceae bacterium]|nr:fatty acid desaturase family protein [Burkholderiaceae bacterium]
MSHASSLCASDRVRAGLEIERELLLEFSRPAPWTLLFHTLLEWALIVAAIVLAVHSGVWVSLLAIAFIGTRQHALLVLMHEFSHRQFSRTRPGLNDMIGDALTALPLFITIHGFRRDHMQHHRAPSTDEDPNWTSSLRRSRYRFPRTRPQMAWLLFLHGIGFYALQDIKGYLFDASMATRLPFMTKLRQALLWLAVAVAASAFNLWSVLAVYWIVPMLTVLMALLYLRDVAEHHAMPGRGLEASRTTLAGPLESFLIAPHAVGLHAEHHLYPSVPFCRLRRLHRLLSTRAGYIEHAVVTRGYLAGMLREVSHAR